MADHFAVIDVGSNALRWQVAAVDHPKHYRILAQDRRPVRLGQDVFRTGKLNPQAVEAALKVLADFRDVARRYRAKAIRAAATSAMREASDRRSFLKRAHALGVPLEVLPEQEEARLISLGIMSGLRFHLPLGLFLDIGGGSVELTVADPANTYCSFSLQLGAVRLTEEFFTKDPPPHRELKELRTHIQDQLRSVARRIQKEKFTMAFGSGGTDYGTCRNRYSSQRRRQSRLADGAQATTAQSIARVAGCSNHPGARSYDQRRSQARRYHHCGRACIA